MISLLKQYHNKLKCRYRGHHWYCDRTEYSSMTMTKFYHWICLTCYKEETTELRDWEQKILPNPQHELDATMPERFNHAI